MTIIPTAFSTEIGAARQRELLAEARRFHQARAIRRRRRVRHTFAR
jgi:hypothetical protein